MPDILIRNVPDATLASLGELAHRAKVSRLEYIRLLLDDQASGLDPDLVLGFFQVQGGETSTCAECGQPLTDGAWLGVTGAYRLFGPVCTGCATTK